MLKPATVYFWKYYKRSVECLTPKTYPLFFMDQVLSITRRWLIFTVTVLKYHTYHTAYSSFLYQNFVTSNKKGLVKLLLKRCWTKWFSF